MEKIRALSNEEVEFQKATSKSMDNFGFGFLVFNTFYWFGRYNLVYTIVVVSMKPLIYVFSNEANKKQRIRHEFVCRSRSTIFLMLNHCSPDDGAMARRLLLITTSPYLSYFIIYWQNLNFKYYYILIHY